MGGDAVLPGRELKHGAPDQRRYREGEGEPEPVPEHLDAMAGVFVVPAVVVPAVVVRAVVVRPVIVRPVALIVVGVTVVARRARIHFGHGRVRRM